MIVYVAKKEQKKYFVQNKLVKITFFYMQTLSLWSLAKYFFTIQGIAGSWYVLYYELPHHIKLDTSSLTLTYILSNFYKSSSYLASTFEWK